MCYPSLLWMALQFLFLDMVLWGFFSSLIPIDVLYAPKYHLNLLSIGCLVKSLNCSVTFYASHCLFQDLNTRKTIGGGVKVDGVYFLAGISSLVCAMLSSSISPYQWHCRLGHLSTEVLKNLGLLPRSSDSLECEACQLGKHHRVSFSSSISKRCSSPFKLIHSDI